MKSINKFTKIKTGAIALFIGLGFQSFAQSNTLLVNFETSNTTPSSKSYASLDPITTTDPTDPSISMTWIMAGVYLGSADATNEYTIDNHSARLRLTNNSSGEEGYIESVDYFTNGVESISFSARMWGNDASSSLKVEYQPVGSSTWTQAGNTATIPTMAEGATTFDFDVNQTDPVKIRIIKGEATNTRINIDNIEITSYATATDGLYLTQFSPTGNNISLATTHLSMTFNHEVSAGSGNIGLYEEGNNMPIFEVDASDAAVTILENVVNIEGINLDYETQYYVLMEEGAFVSGALSSIEIDDPSVWTFTTVSESVAMGEFLESFEECDNVTSSFGVFTEYSVLGTRTWRCGSFGFNDTYAVYINGGSSSSESEINEDWLITKSPIDLSNATHPILKFAHQTRFSGHLEKAVQVSIDYDGIGNPNDFTWTTLNIPSYATESSHGVWNTHEYALDNGLENTPFYLAFTYKSDENGAQELTLDEIQIESTVSIVDLSNDVRAMILGQPTTNEILLNIESSTAQETQIKIFDLQGRLAYEALHRLNQHQQLINISPNLAGAGLYLVQISINNKSYTLKAFVQ